MPPPYHLQLISPVPVLRYNPPRPLVDVYNAPKRTGYNPNYSEVGDRVGHDGVDIGPPWGVVSPWVAPIDAKVHNAAWLNSLAGYGVELVTPAEDPVLAMRGLHMAATLLVSRGELVAQGQKLGTVSNTAKPLTRWVHTHFWTHWLRDGYDPNVPLIRQGVPVDPLDFGLLEAEDPELELVRITVDRPVLRRQVKPYVEDPAVQLLQSILNQADVLDLTPGVNFDPDTLLWDGKFGPSTEEAVLRYQLRYDLVEDGIVGAATWAHMLDHRVAA